MFVCWRYFKTFNYAISYAVYICMYFSWIISPYIHYICLCVGFALILLKKNTIILKKHALIFLEFQIKCKGLEQILIRTNTAVSIFKRPYLYLNSSNYCVIEGKRWKTVSKVLQMQSFLFVKMFWMFADKPIMMIIFRIGKIC